MGRNDFVWSADKIRLDCNSLRRNFRSLKLRYLRLAIISILFLIVLISGYLFIDNTKWYILYVACWYVIYLLISFKSLSSLSDFSFKCIGIDDLVQSGLDIRSGFINDGYIKNSLYDYMKINCISNELLTLRKEIKKYEF